MATELEFVNYKQFVENLPAAQDYASGDKTVVCNPTNGPRSMPGSAKDRSTTITDFRTGDVIPVDGPDGPAKMSKDDLLEETAKHMLNNLHSLPNKYTGYLALNDSNSTGKFPIDNLIGSIAEIYVPGTTNAVAGKLYMYQGKCWLCNENTSGEWDGSKFFEKELVKYIEESVNNLGSIVNFNAVSGSAVSLRTPMKIHTGDKIIFKVDGADGIISQNKMNLSLYLGGVRVQYFDSLINDFGKWYEVTASSNADEFEVDRGSAIGNGNLKLSVLVEGLLYDFLNENIESLSSEITGIRNDIDGYRESSVLNLGIPTTGYAYDQYGDLFENDESSYANITFDSSNAGKAINITLSSATNNSRFIVLCDDNNAVKEKISNGTIAHDGGSYDFTVIPQTGWKLMVSWRTANGTPSVSSFVDHPSILEKAGGVMYVSPSGDDDDAGTKASPKKSVSAAVSSGAKSVILLEGVYDDNSIDLSRCVDDKVTLKGEEGKSIIFKKSSSKIVDDGSESLVSGYSNVYQVSVLAEPDYNAGNKWLFFDGLNDENTAIAVSDAHPMERGLFYRNDCTKIVKCSSERLADALDEIESATDYRWFFDSGKLYFNRAASTSTYPIYKSVGNYFVTRANQSVLITNIEFRYGVVNLIGLNSARIENVSAKYVYGAGCFVYDNSIGVEFVRCEAASAFFGWRGDGFNGHVTGVTSDTAKCCNAIFTDCWSHDCADDGYSDHEYCETTINGGLYEYNGKGGIVPSYGSHCVCNNVYSRYNKVGFYYLGSVEDHGNDGQVVCYNCIAENNNLGGTSDNAGFRVQDSGNRMILMNCKSINDHYAFRVGSNTYMEAIDCGCVGAYRDTDVSERGTLVKIKTTTLE